MFDCRGYDDMRQAFQALFPLDGRKDLKRFMNCTDQGAVAKFIHLSMQRREATLERVIQRG